MDCIRPRGKHSRGDSPLGEYGAAALGLVPIVPGVRPTSSAVEVLRDTIALAEAGTLTVIGDISTQTFEVAP